MTPTAGHPGGRDYGDMSEHLDPSITETASLLAERHAVLRRLTAALGAAMGTTEICEVTASHLRDRRLGISAAAVLLIDAIEGRLRVRAGDDDTTGHGDVASATLFDGGRVTGELRIACSRDRGSFDHADQQLLDAVARLVDMALSRSRLATMAGADAPSAWMQAVSGNPVGRRVQVGEIPVDLLSEVYFGEAKSNRPTRWAAVAAIIFHFVVFAVMFPDFSRDLPDLTRDLTVIRRYKPPPPEQRENKPQKRSAKRVPIPDPTPDDPEPIVPEEEEDLPELPVDTIFIADLPVSSPLPRDFLNALDIETANLIPPRLTKRVQPHYDRERARRGIQGSADLQILIDDGGRVAYVQVVNSTGDDELDRLALEAVQQWEFTSAVLEGAPVSVRAVVTINFRIY